MKQIFINKSLFANKSAVFAKSLFTKYELNSGQFVWREQFDWGSYSFIKAPQKAKIASGVRSGFRVLSKTGIGEDSVSFQGSVYNNDKAENIDLSGETLKLSAGDKYIVMSASSNLISAKQTEPADNEILLCTLGFVFNPYEPSRHLTVEGIPDNWASKDLSKASYLWHPVPIDDEEAKLAYENFHTGNMPYHLPNSGLTGCQVAEADLSKEPISESGTATTRFFLGTDQLTENIYFDGVRIELKDGASNAKLKNCVIKGHNLKHHYMIRPQAGDNNLESSNVVFENLTVSFFDDEQSENTETNADLFKPAQGTTFINIKAFNTPNDPFKLDRFVTYDGFEAYNLGYLAGSHCDGFQATGSSSRLQEFIEVRNGTIWMASPESINGDSQIKGDVNACLYLDPDYGPLEDDVSIKDVTLENCFLNGGVHSIYIVNETTQGFKVRDVRVRNVMLGLDFSRSFASDIAAGSAVDYRNKAGDAIVEWENVRRIDNGELISKPTVGNDFVSY